MDDSNCKRSFAPPALFRMVQWNRYTDWEGYFNNGYDWFLAWKKIERFFVRQGFPPFFESPISIWTVSDTQIKKISVRKKNLHSPSYAYLRICIFSEEITAYIYMYKLVQVSI